MCRRHHQDAQGDARMAGRLVTSFSYQQGSAMDHIMRRMRDANKNVSEVITDIITNHYELYDQVQHLTEQLQQQARQHSYHRDAANTAGLTLVNHHDDLGFGKNVLRSVYKDRNGDNQYDGLRGEEE
jgi:hypothetical protein